jgi:hypothetical protein
MLRGNLSTRPFYNDRAVTLAIAGVALLVALMTAYNATRIVSLTGRRSAIQNRITISTQQAAQLRAQATTTQQGIDRASLLKLALSAREANELIGSRTFSWTELFGLLEHAMPMDVRLLSVSPRFEKGERVVTMDVAARTLPDISEFTDALAKTGAFQHPVAIEQQGRDDGTYAATIEGVYVPVVAPATAPPPDTHGEKAGTPQPRTLLQPEGAR